MKKFIAAFDGLQFSKTSLQYAIFLTKKANAHLVGVFLEDFTRRSYSIADITMYEGVSFEDRVRELDEKDQDLRQEAVQEFEEECQAAGINFTVHRDRNIALHELLHESIYADLLIVDARETVTPHREPVPTRFIRELLADVQCPVVVVPSDYKPIEKFSILYDGEPSSVFAVRMFSYLFGKFEMETDVITVKSAEQSLHLPDNRLMREYMKRHFPNAGYVVIKGNPEDMIVRHLVAEQQNCFIILGAYRRSRLSRVFKASMADLLIKYLKFPLFIAHNKS